MSKRLLVTKAGDGTSRRREEEIMNTAQKLLQGSRNIDQMRKDISQVVQIIIGMIDVKNHCCESTKREYSFTSRFRKGYWHVKFLMGEILILYKSATNSASVVIVFSSQDLKKQKVEIGTKVVQEIYEALPIFVEGMIKNFPKHSSNFEALLKAGKIRV